MNDFALFVHVLKAHEDLLSYTLDNINGYATVTILLDQRQKVWAKDFEAHANMRPVRALMLEPVPHLDNASSPCIKSVGRVNFIQQFDFVECRFRVV